MLLSLLLVLVCFLLLLLEVALEAREEGAHQGAGEGDLLELAGPVGGGEGGDLEAAVGEVHQWRWGWECVVVVLLWWLFT